MSRRELFYSLPGLLVLVACFAAGQALVSVFAIPLPSALVGLGLMFSVFLVLGKVPTSVRLASRILLTHMSIFFIPATLGAVFYADQLAEHGLALLIALVATTLLSLGITGAISQFINRKSPIEQEGD